LEQAKSERVIAMNYQLQDGIVDDDHYGNIFSFVAQQ